jgi:hypothetical protein
MIGANGEGEGRESPVAKQPSRSLRHPSPMDRDSRRTRLVWTVPPLLWPPGLTTITAALAAFGTAGGILKRMSSNSPGLTRWGFGFAALAVALA